MRPTAPAAPATATTARATTAATVPEPATFTLDLEPPFDVAPALATLALHAIPGAEHPDTSAATHTRLFPDADGPVPVTVAFAPGRVTVTVPGGVAETCVAQLTPRIRRWLDLDADPAAIGAVLSADRMLAPLVAARPGLRIIGAPDPFEAAITTVLGQQVSLAACRTFAGRLVAAFGSVGAAGLTAFPTPEALAAETPERLQQAIGLTGARARTALALAEACADGLVLDPDGDHADARRRLLAVPGIGAWTADYIAVRVLGDRDAFAPGDLVLRRALGGISAREAEARSHAWSPLRAYALFHLWTATAYCPPPSAAASPPSASALGRRPH